MPGQSLSKGRARAFLVPSLSRTDAPEPFSHRQEAPRATAAKLLLCVIPAEKNPPAVDGESAALRLRTMGNFSDPARALWSLCTASAYPG